ncbi:Protein SCO2, mitochondrial [Nymphon striatum]|nr:Protein SCO2, mitochondrial [Nymphon striatum]
MTPKDMPILRPIKLDVDIEGIEASQVDIDFVGIDMEMGYNRPALESKGKGRFEGKTIIPGFWVKLELANTSDVIEVCSLLNLAYRGDEGWTTESELVTGNRCTENDIRSDINSSNNYLLVHRTDNCIRASISIQKIDNNAYIGSFAVHPEFQNSGFGKTILLLAEQYAISSFQPEKFILLVLSSRTELIEYYERRGYIRTGNSKAFPFHLNVGVPVDPNVILALNQMNEDELSAMQSIFVSVDPERDNTTRLDTYTKYFHSNLIGATAERSEIDRMTKLYGASYRVVKSDSAMGYIVDHSAYTYLIDKTAPSTDRTKAFARKKPLASIPVWGCLGMASMWFGLLCSSDFPHTRWGG